MILIRHQRPQSKKRSVILLFGTGLIGTSIVKGLHKDGEAVCRELPFNWADGQQQARDAEEVFAGVISAVDAGNGDAGSPLSIALVWSAGKAGFFASQEETDRELESYRLVLSLLEKIRVQFPESNIECHLLSSAGGLFEDQSLVDAATQPAPKRLYGHLKHEQEKLLTNLGGDFVRLIYRPTSVYGYSGPGKRMGLIPTLILNGIQNKTSTIFGGLSTLRDYVFNDDIGDYVAGNIGSVDPSSETSIRLLGSGKPSSIFEIQHFVERVIRKKIYLNFISSPETDNATDIIISSAGLPLSWRPIDVKTGVQHVKDLMMAG
jgi:nucleoside-diphosphate-sugar epimerase